MDFGCAAYCNYAEQCVGELPPELLAQRDDLLKDRVAIEMKRYFKRDYERIDHATRVARYAEKLVIEEKGDPAVVLSAAYLHELGLLGAEAEHLSEEPQSEQGEGSQMAREILKRLEAREDLIEEVCDIVNHHHRPRPQETVNFKIVYDADLVAKLEEKQEAKPIASETVNDFIEKSFLTKSGREMAKDVLLNLRKGAEETTGP
jgi:HD superfamily phosphodiesterase